MHLYVRGTEIVRGPDEHAVIAIRRTFLVWVIFMIDRTESPQILRRLYHALDLDWSVVQTHGFVPQLYKEGVIPSRDPGATKARCRLPAEREAREAHASLRPPGSTVEARQGILTGAD